MKKTIKNKFLVILLAIMFVAISIARIVWLYITWPPADTRIIENGEVWDNNGVQLQVVDSVLGTAKETLEYYECPSEGISEDEIIQSISFGWHGYVLAVKVRFTNTTSEDIVLGQYMCIYSESSSWFNGYQMTAVPLYNTTSSNIIQSGTSRDFVFPYIVYQEHFQSSAWAKLAERKFYLDSQSVYPIKIQLDCTPTFLSAAQSEFNI